MATRSVLLVPLPLPLLCCVLASCGSDPSPPEAPEASSEHAARADRRPHVVLITLDTTRADRIGTYGHAAARTPTIDGMAAEGIRFEHAYAVVPLTTPAHASMLTGLYPTRHGVHNNGDAVLPEDLPTLAEELSAAGYRTAAAVSAFVTTRVWNLDQGFDAYFDDLEAGGQRQRWSRERPAASVVDDLIGWLEEQPEDDQPTFLWAHLYDPHAPYLPPSPWDEQLEDPYDAEIAYVDAQLARLEQAVQERLGERVAWVVVADHGESLGLEHGEHEHGLFLYDTTTRVPFIIRPAAPLPEPVRVADAVSNTDVMPTVLGLAGLQPPADLDGRDLSGFRADSERGPVYLESEVPLHRFGYHPEWAVADDRWKLMHTPSPRLFDVVADPQESRDIHAQHPELVARLEPVVEAVQARAEAHAGAAPSPDVYAQLEALGYVSGPSAERDDLPAIDAKDRLSTIKRLQRARHLSTLPEEQAAAAALYEQVLADEPQIAEARVGLAKTLGARGQLEQAEEVLREAVQQHPSSTVLRTNLAYNLAAQGRHDEGYALMASVHEQVPGDEIARLGMLRMLTDQGHYGEAITFAEQWLDEDPDNHSYRAVLGVALAKRGEQPGRAYQLLQATLADGVPRQLVHRTLGQLEGRRGNLEAAIEHQQQESLWFPADRAVRRELAELLMTAERWEEAAAEYAWLSQSNQGVDPRLRLGWAQAEFNQASFERAAEILQPALEAAPEDPALLLLYANLLAKQGQRERGREVFERAQALRAAKLARP